MLVPVDYEELLSYYTHRGYRVIACATKHIENLSWPKVQQMRRQEVESNLEFIGLIIFENKLKKTTAAVIDELNSADIRKVMCTGDNILTAISVARECNLIDRTAHCFIPHLLEGIEFSCMMGFSMTDQSQGDSLSPKRRLQWQSVDNSLFTLDENTLMVRLMQTRLDKLR